jgi:hypothetical protein
MSTIIDRINYKDMTHNPITASLEFGSVGEVIRKSVQKQVGDALLESSKVSKMYAGLTAVAFVLDCCIFIVFLSHMGGAEVEATHEPVNAFSKISFVAGFIVADLYVLFWCLY